MSAVEAPVEEKMLGIKHGHIAQITFNNPARHNAVSLEMWERMTALLADFAADPNLRVLVVTGAGGKAFVSGADISKFESQRSSEKAVAHYNKVSSAAYEALYRFPKPTIARIQGYCIGGGMNVAICCDMRIASEGSKFGIPAARLGLGYGYEGLRRLTEVVGLARAMELFYTARQLTAQEAASIGLVNQVVPEVELAAAVDAVTRQISENAPMTIATIKAAAREMGRPSTERDLAKVDAMVAACFASEDYTEGRRAFMEKRKPAFKGR